MITADSREELEKLVERDEEGKVIRFKIDKHAIWMSNHQVSYSVQEDFFSSVPFRSE